MTIAVLITRPDSSGIELADQLRNRWGCGVEMIVSPVTEIEFIGTLPDLTPIQTLIFTSQNGVAAFARLSDRRDLQCYAVGPTTADRARAEGFDVVHSSRDAVTLLDLLVAEDPPAPCLHIRGMHVASDIARHLTDAGLPTQEVILYDQRECPLSTAAKECLRGGTPVILPLYSPRNAKLVFKDVQPKAPVLIAAISSNVAKNVPKDVVNHLLIADQPNAEAMFDVLDKLFEQAKRLEGVYRAQ